MDLEAQYLSYTSSTPPHSQNFNETEQVGDLGWCWALNSVANHTNRSTSVGIEVAHQVAQVQHLRAGWDDAAVVECDTLTAD